MLPECEHGIPISMSCTQCKANEATARALSDFAQVRMAERTRIIAIVNSAFDEAAHETRPFDWRSDLDLIRDLRAAVLAKLGEA